MSDLTDSRRKKRGSAASGRTEPRDPANAAAPPQAEAAPDARAGQAPAPGAAPEPPETGAKRAGEASQTVAAATAAEVGEAAAPGDDETAAEPTHEEQVADLKDRLLRAVAETENTRRRADRDKREIGKYAVTALARDLLAVADNLRRALESVPEGASQESDMLATLLAGVDMTERDLLSAFERHDIRRIDPMGEKFDHNFHQAMFEVPGSGQPAGTIVQVMQPGYILADRLLRPAMVGVAKDDLSEETQGHVDTTV